MGVKFANITYGTHGDTEEYTYAVDDSAKAGDMMQPSVRHYESGKIFGTTGIIQDTAGETTVRGQQLKQEMESKGVEPANAYSMKEAGVISGVRESGTGRFATSKGLTQKDQNTGMYVESGTKTVDVQSEQHTRKYNVEHRDSQRGETFNSYMDRYDGGQQ